jgi:hypothetical protein
MPESSKPARTALFARQPPPRARLGARGLPRPARVESNRGCWRQPRRPERSSRRVAVGKFPGSGHHYLKSTRFALRIGTTPAARGGCRYLVSHSGVRTCNFPTTSRQRDRPDPEWSREQSDRLKEPRLRLHAVPEHDRPSRRTPTSERRACWDARRPGRPDPRGSVSDGERRSAASSRPTDAHQSTAAEGERSADVA